MIDDGSKDRTSEVVAAAFADDPRVRLLTLREWRQGARAQPGAGAGRRRDRHRARRRHAVRADHDRAAGALVRRSRRSARSRATPRSATASIWSPRWQALEYITAQNLERRALARAERDDGRARARSARGGWRRSARSAAIPHDTLAEDQDLTIAIQRAGWTVTYDQYAVAWTEAPGDVPRPRQAALPLGVRHAAMPVEARPRSWRRGRPRGLGVDRPAAGDPVPDRARRDLADHRSRADRQLRHDLSRDRGAWLGADAARRREDAALLAGLHRDRPARRRSSPSRSSGARNGGCCGC